MNRYSRVHAEINLDAILHNLDAMHAVISENTKIMAVIKADGYESRHCKADPDSGLCISRAV